MTEREQAQQRYAADQLAALAADVAATGSGARNVTLNRAALAAGHLLGAGAVSREQIERALLAAALRAGLRESEARGTIRSGLRAGAREPAFQRDRDPQRTSSPPLAVVPAPTDADESRYHDLVIDLIERCPMGGEVARYLGARGLPTDASPDVIALPAPSEQPELLVALIERHGRDALIASGLVESSGQRLLWPDHRVGFVYRDAVTGAPSTIQRRCLGTPLSGIPKTVFSKGRRVTWPFGAQNLLRGVPRSEPVTLLEGVVDWLSWQALYPYPDAAPAIALPSAAALRPEWLSLLAKRDVFVALDSDEAGSRASSQIIEQLRPLARPLRIRPWPGDKDWGDAAARLARSAS